MRLVEKAENYPARCFVTANFEGPFVDFESSSGDYGALYLHPSVIEQAADLLGYVPKEKFVALKEQVSAWADECDRLRGRLDALETLKKLEDDVREEVAA